MYAFQVCYVFSRQRDLEGFEVLVKMLDFASANDGKDVWILLHHIGDCDYTVDSIRNPERG